MSLIDCSFRKYNHSSCTLGSINTDDITYFCCIVQAEGWKSTRPTVDSPSSGNVYTAKHKLSDLPPGSYQAKLKAKNQFGWSQLSEPQVFSGGK